ncbi:lecithin-cholesterol acyltransferase-like 4 [Pistacia vera]|uniref:lecithin-cholesterol acyltransferase-like 4 n=1 Tax=Pistacia vera TaxID=55513 RepID=UPI001263BA22|nr:lecithin-cholesterol acyltransferase-like 4 [Pistacia vera]
MYLMVSGRLWSGYSSTFQYGDSETRKILLHAKVPPKVKFHNICGINLETPHSVGYGSEDAPVADLSELRFLQAKYVCVDGGGTVPTESAKVL